MNRWVLCLLLGMGALIALSGAEIIRLRAERDAKPAIEKAQHTELNTGPKKITQKKTEKITPQEGGKAPIKETVTETVTEIESQQKVSDSLLKETPASVLAPKPIRSRIGLELAPLAFSPGKPQDTISGVDGELIFKQTFGVGAGWAFKGDLKERPRAKLSVYFR